ncbi:hypothetical protein LSH36_3g23052 [Paralvinella palmiformis]|uniref:Uncharacterized protein n=1 Tax=Paralvinella palmiformis TaxID=53620 RepID=A0AAD9NJA9_9ANNE|nr:hypothetical protein LSH36_3g23052 [Paralvinella palmiformis]
MPMVLSMISSGIVAYNLHLYELWRLDTSHLSYMPNQMDTYHIMNHTTDITLLNINDSLVYEMTDTEDYVHMKIVQAIFLCALIIACLLFGAAIFLIVGVSLDKKNLLIPWIVVMAINIVLDTGTMTYHTTLIIYCLLCVFSQYQELKLGRGTREYIRRTRAQVLYHPSIQQVHINQGPIIINGQLPRAITSSVQTGNLLQGASNQVTATLLVSAPDYDIAASQLPQYHETTGAPADNKDPLLSAPVTISVPYSTQGNDSPPPPYSD